MNMKKAIYAFSGDPITFGHIDIVKRAGAIFDKVIVGIGQNPDKKYMFTLKERELMAKKSLANIPDVKVISFSGLLVDYAYENDIPVIIKGIRGNSDLDYEMLLHEIGESQKQGIETFFIPAKKELSHISSSTVKALQAEQGLIHEFVPLYVKQCLEKKISEQLIIGVTGEIGSGKSYICKKVIELGEKEGLKVHNIELDHIGHQITNKLKEPLYGNVRNDISSEFGKEVLMKDGFIDRKKLGEIVFRKKRNMEKLNSLIKKPLLIRIRRELHNKKGIILFNAALIAESDMAHLCNNNIILVKTDKKSQKRRLHERKLTDSQIKRRLASQFDFNEKKKRIKSAIKKDNQGKLWIIDNPDNNNYKKIDKKIKKLLKEIKGNS